MRQLRALRARVGTLATIAIGLVAVLVLAQAVPYGRSHANPHPTKPVAFVSAHGKQLFAAACGDCHSDLTRWPWYSNIAPISWLAQRDVDEGRGALNVSEWDKPQPELGDVVEQITGSGMPPWQFKLTHSDADLSKSQRTELAAELTRMYQRDPPPAGTGGG